MISLFFKQTILVSLVVSLLVPSGLFLYPKKVQAEAGNCAAVIGSVVLAITTLGTVQTFKDVPTYSKSGTAAGASSAGSGYGQFFNDCILVPAAIKFAKSMLQNITGNIIDWINGGFHGKPLFVKDLNGLIQDTTDQAIGSFIENDLKAGFLCNSFSFQVKIQLAQTYLPYRQRSACTLKQITNNVNGFIDSNNSGGWDNWLEVTTVPQNNVYGATILAQDELSRQILNRVGIKKDTLSWGKGFMGVDVCLEAADGVTKSLKDIDANNPMECKKRDAHTPGAVVESQLENALGSSVRELELANDMNAILGALSNQLIAQVVKGGVGLLGTKTKSTTYSQTLNATGDPQLSAAINSAITRSEIDTGLDSSVGATDPTNFAIFASATGSVTAENSDPLNATDGDTTTVFASTNAANSSLTVDLRAIKEFSGIKILSPDPVSDGLGSIVVSAYNTLSDSNAGVNPSFTQTINAQSNPTLITTNSSGRFIKVQKQFGSLKIAEIEVLPPIRTGDVVDESLNTTDVTDQTSAATTVTPTVLTFTSVPQAGNVTVANPLKYQVSLNTNHATSSLFINTTLKRDSAPVAFLSVFSSLTLRYGKLGTYATTVISNQNQNTHALMGVSTEPQLPYVISYEGIKKVGNQTTPAPVPGTYSIVTTVESPSGTVIQTKTDTFIVQ